MLIPIAKNAKINKINDLWKMLPILFLLLYWLCNLEIIIVASKLRISITKIAIPLWKIKYVLFKGKRRALRKVKTNDNWPNIDKIKYWFLVR